jgi:hypothetical protein
MRLNVLRFIVVALACACAVVVVSNLRAQQAAVSEDKFAALYASLGMPVPVQTPAVPGTQEKTIAQEGREKNVKLLGDMPVSQFIPVMNYFAASMGRRCNFCHVNNNGQWDYAADTKPEKNTAREMIKMVLDVNKTTFKGTLQVSCYTCHRGRNQPQSVPTLPLPMPSPPAANPGGAGPAAGGATAGQAQATPNPTPAMPSADDIFNKYIAAIGQAGIDKLKTRTAKGTIAQANGNSFQFELSQSGDKFYFKVTTPQGSIERGFDGQVGWEKTARGVREITGGELVTFKAGNGLFVLISLKDQYARAPRVRRDKLGDRDVYVTDGTMADGKRLRFYFDAATGLLLRRVTFTPTMIGNIPDQLDIEDYRDVDGVKFGFIARSSTIETGNPISTRTFTEMKVNTAVDESKFKMPAAAASPNP